MQTKECEHIVLDVVTEPFLKGLSDYVGVECTTCFAYFEVEDYKEFD